MTSPDRSVIWSWQLQSEDDPFLETVAQERTDVILLKAMAEHKGHSSSALPSVTRSQLKRLIEEGHVTVNDKPLKANAKIKPGILIRIEFPPAQPTDLIPENRPLEVLFEDEHILVINKSPRITVHPSATQMEGTLVHALLHHIQDLSGIGGKLRPGIVHRIDKNTSGALVITKSDIAHLKLAEVFSKHEIERSYWALCYGAPHGAIPQTSIQNGLIKIESLIGRNPTDRKKMSMKVKSGRKAVSYFKKLQEFSLAHKKPFASWLEVTLETGRTHQVRVHLTGIGHSLLGDPVYGPPSENQSKWVALPKNIKEAVLQLPGQALHARVLGFKHPITGKHLRFEAAPPKEFSNLLEALRLYSS